MQDFENNPEQNVGSDGENNTSPSDNGCTYHTGRINNESFTPNEAPQSGDGEVQSPDGGCGSSDNSYKDPLFGDREPSESFNNTDGGYARPYNANQYPNGQQNRQYGTNGQPPIGGAYPYYGSGRGGNGGSPKRNTGLIVLIIALCLTVIIAGFGIASVFLGINDTEKPNTVEDEEPVTNTNGPSLNIVKDDAPHDKNSVTSEEVYKKIRESSVGVLLYDKESKKLASEGSGVIIGEDADGKFTYVITCAHVINSPDMTYKVMLFDDTSYSAEVVGYDTRTDIGVLKIEASGLKAAEFGDISSVAVGQTVYAIGNPGGSEFAGSFTNGMVSAISRPISSKTGYTTKCIQHTAAINPGNSGGALVNANGQVIGINSMKIVETEYEGMAFAVPVNIVSEIVDKLIAYGYIPDRAKLGITYLPSSSNEAYSIVVQIKGLPKGSIIIQEISPDSGLAGTAVEVGDMIVAVNGQNLDTTDALASVIENSSIGDTITLSIVRINEDYSLKEFTVTVKLVADKGSAEQAETTVPTPSDFFDPFG